MAGAQHGERGETGQTVAEVRTGCDWRSPLGENGMVTRTLSSHPSRGIAERFCLAIGTALTIPGLAAATAPVVPYWTPSAGLVLVLVPFRCIALHFFCLCHLFSSIYLAIA